MSIAQIIQEIAPKLPLIAENERQVYQSGVNLGMSQGYDVGFDDGRNSLANVLVDSVTNNGTRSSLQYTFAYWHEFMFYPSCAVRPTGQCASTFMSFKGQIDLASRLEECGVEFDFGKSTNVGYIFMNAEFTRLPKLNFSNSSTLESILYNMPYLETVDEIVIKDDGSQAFTNGSFMSTPNLKNLKITGKIGKNGLNVQWSPLARESLLSIKNALEDKSNDTSGTAWIVTFGATNKAKLTDTEIKEIELKGWEVK